MLFPFMVFTRKLLPGTQSAASDVNLYSRPIDVLCRVATHIETMLLRAGMKFPFGGSVIAIAAKRGVAHG
jgi:hypothetical protein